MTTDLVQCLSEGEMFFFLQLTGLSTQWLSDSLMQVMSEIPALWSWNGDQFCVIKGSLT